MNPEGGPSPEESDEKNKTISIDNAELQNADNDYLIDVVRTAGEKNFGQVYRELMDLEKSIPEDMQEAFTKTRWFHIISRSGIDSKVWQGMPDDLPGNVLVRFIKEKIAPLAEQEKS